ncbi:MAG: ABC transporter ATP-binding protein [Armatimonadota bacterium]|nr:ABC transporter ATP-binding protein [Armatimonadota bacterium]MDR7450458.1 ABC transporter ATP-binding protein [Armatimonadota bacterium]MDR7466959.1 ABC transporter ATP-binding protein [Armatimonadota bacterium]MDR7493499.1 ABC transporter ATP-binding protein [Armatimonadota bacterium]MDR7498764.1 ABC transporter ATP-binding protein [Armatimonadota bacterium]
MATLNNIEVVYWGTILVLKGVSLTVPEGKITALIGANGAGKTTTLKAITGLVRLERGEVTRGSVEFAGRRIQNLLPEETAQMGIVMVREGRRLFEELTAEENLLVGAALRRGRRGSGHGAGDGPATGAGIASLESVYGYFPRLRERRRVRAGYLSGGEQQMLAIGCAMMAAPRLLLLDEPSLGLAPLVAREIFGLIHRLNTEAGMTILLVEQNAKMALDLASYGYIMENGKIVLDGPAAKLREDADVEEFYLGVRGAERRRFTEVKSYKRRKRWLA